MKAARLTAPGHIEIVEIERPEIKEGNQVLVRVKAAGICGTDLHTFKGERNDVEYPRIMGHELSGFVEDVGENVSRVKPGDRVVYDPVNACGSCKICRSGHENVCSQVKCFGVQMDGGFQEYIVVNEDHLYPYRGSASYECAALGEPFSIAANIVGKTRIKAKESAVIFGAGTIGIAVLQVLKKMGVRVLVTDIADEKLEMAKTFEADETVNSRKEDLKDKVEQFSTGGVEAVIDAAGSAFTLEQAVELAAPSGTVVEIGFDGRKAAIAPEIITKRELTIAGSRMNCHKFDIVAGWLEDGTITDSMISAIYPLDEIQKAFEETLKNNGHWLKTMIRI